MGKNRHNINNPSVYELEQGLPFPPSAHRIIPTDGHSPEWMDAFIQHMALWVNFGAFDPNNGFSKEEREYILKNMEPLSESYRKQKLLWGETDPDMFRAPTVLVRIEKQHHFNKQNLKKGDKLSSNHELRSFSRDERLPSHLMDEYTGKYEGGATIYIIKGDTKQYDVNYLEPFQGEKESFVDSNSLVVSDTKKYRGSNEKMVDRIYDDYGIDLSSARNLPSNIRIVELTQEN